MQEDSDSPRSDHEEGPSLSLQEELSQLMSSFVHSQEWLNEHAEDFIRISDHIGEIYKRMRQRLEQETVERRLQYFKRSKIALQDIYSNYEAMASLGSIAARDSLPSLRHIITDVEELITKIEWWLQNYQEELQRITWLEQQRKNIEGIYEKSRQKSQNIKRMNEEIHNLLGNLRVILKIRPIQSQKARSQKEFDVMRENVIIKWKSMYSIELFETIPGILPKTNWITYNVDQVFSPNIRQREVFRSVAYLVHKMFENERCALLCLGQAGSGNTYTMIGSIQSMEIPFLTQDSGIVPRALQEAFEIIDKERQKGRNLHLGMYFREYCLDTSKKGGSKPKFSKPSLVVTEEEPILLESLKDALIVLGIRMRRRKEWRTEMGQISSLSHMLVCLQLLEGPDMKEIGQLCLIDLAGDDQMSEDHPQDSIYINSSLLELRECLKLAKKKPSHAWRGNLIVESLKPDLEGRKTLLIVNLSSKKENEQHNKTSMSFAMDIMNFNQ